MVAFLIGFLKILMQCMMFSLSLNKVPTYRTVRIRFGVKIGETKASVYILIEELFKKGDFLFSYLKKYFF